MEILEYNRLENGQESRTLDEVRPDLLNDRTESLLIYSGENEVDCLEKQL